MISDIPKRDFKLAEKRGLAVLVTCDYGGTLAVERDAKEMKETFEHFGYEIAELKNNKATYDQITNLLKQVSQYLGDYKGTTDEKVLIFAFSGHGATGDRIATCDHPTQYLSLEKDIIQPFVENPGVYEIPKLFFIDACRGREHLKGDIPLDSPLESLKQCDSDVKGETHLLSNFRIDYATIPNHVARTHNWMCYLAQDIRNDSPKSSIQDIAVSVRAKVHKAQVCEAVDRLKKKFYFKK